MKPAAVKTLFLTGTTGGLGQELLKRYLEKTSDRLLLLVRSKRSESHEQRIHKILQKAGINGNTLDRISVLAGDVAQPGLGLSGEDRARVICEADEFHHIAALTNLGARREEAYPINVEGTLQVLELARDALKNGKLRRFFYFSTAYVAGSLTPVHSLEDHLPASPLFANAYEETKFLAENKVREAAKAGLPVTIYRPSIVVGDSESGAISDFNVVYPFWRLFVHGLLKKVPAIPGNSINLVPIDFVVKAAFALSQREDTLGKTFHLVTENPPTLETLIRVKNEYKDFPEVEVVSPQNFSFGNLSEQERSIFASIRPYMGYLGSTLTFDTRNIREALRKESVPFPNTDRVFLKRLIDYAIEKGYFLSPN